MANFPSLRVFNVPVKGVPLGILAVGLKKPAMPLPDDGKSLTMWAFVSIQYQRVTDRETDLLTQYRALHA